MSPWIERTETTKHKRSVIGSSVDVRFSNFFRACLGHRSGEISFLPSSPESFVELNQ